MSLSPQLDPLPERMKRMLCTGVGADVHFLVGQEGDQQQELLHAHTSVLRTASDVFDAMFRFDAESGVLAKKQKITGSSTEVSDSGQVRVPDVDVDAFKTMLDFIYTDNLSGVNGKNAFEMLYAAKKYNLPMLVKACVDIPVSELDNVFFAFAKARFLDEKDFAGRCLAYIDWNADTLLKSDEFLQIDQQLLCELLGRDQLVVNGEIAIWNAALRWADEQCRQKDLDFTAENRRKMLGQTFFHIRFPIIQKDLLKNIASCCMLTKDELIGVLLYHTTENSSNGDTMSEPYPLLFPIRQRSAKSTGKITLKIEKFSELLQADETSQKFSEAVYIRGFQWKICAKINTMSGIRYFGSFFYCTAKNYASDWSCPFSATFRMVSQKQGKADFATNFDHTFNSNSYTYGYYPRFCKLEDLMDPFYGWYTQEEDTVILSAEVTVKE